VGLYIESSKGTSRWLEFEFRTIFRPDWTELDIVR
jgi:hypothetical protein